MTDQELLKLSPIDPATGRFIPALRRKQLAAAARIAALPVVETATEYRGYVIHTTTDQANNWPVTLTKGDYEMNDGYETVEEAKTMIDRFHKV